MAPVDEKAYAIPIHDDGHEQRLQRLEAGQQQMTGQLAAVEVKVDALDSKVDSSTSLITAHIDLAVKPLAQKLHDHIAADGVVAGRVDVVEEKAADSAVKLAAIEAKAAVKRERRDIWYKFLIPVAAAILGACAKIVVDLLRH